MAEILNINEGKVKVGQDSGDVVELPIAVLQFSNPAVGDKVRVYKDGDGYIVKREEANKEIAGANSDTRTVNKVAYVLLTFFIGGLGVHRFMRGQVGLGILMLVLVFLIGPLTLGLGWFALGVWVLIDFIVSLIKLSSYSGDDFVFTKSGHWKE